MKRKILAVGVMSLCWLGLAAGESQAFFGLFNPCNPYSIWNHCNRYTTQITCRPYNAFTPICWGNLVCDGCCPNPCGVAGGCLPMTMGVPPWACGPSCGPMMGGCGAGGCYASDMSPAARPSVAPAPTTGAPPYTAPMPMPVGPNTTMGYPYPPMMMPMPASMQMPMAPNTTMMYPPMNPGVAQVGYQPSYYPMPYYPTGYYPYAGWQQPTPYYWYGAGR